MLVVLASFVSTFYFALASDGDWTSYANQNILSNQLTLQTNTSTTFYYGDSMSATECRQSCDADVSCRAYVVFWSMYFDADWAGQCYGTNATEHVFTTDYGVTSGVSDELTSGTCPAVPSVI